uniref:Replication associated protein n=1 Tax=Microviridae sp. ctZPT1 TaxID=2827645 RepID=A0A8S5SZ44_9VIRU|nr:MAG TPA: Replication associated protein [Microviridae sp. ctZPT1]
MISPIVKPYCSCLHPCIIKNKYTGQPIYSKCGQCEVCLHDGSVQKELKCNIQLADSKHCFFVTLTYATEHLPVGKFYQSSTGMRFCCVPRDHIYSYTTVQGYTRNMSFNDENFDYPVNLSAQAVSDLLSKTHLDRTVYPDGHTVVKYPDMRDLLPYLNYRDLQLFHKRLNQQLKSYSNEKIHTYSVGEYGPKTFRPHFHLLFFFDSDRLAKVFGQLIRKVWRFGDSDTQRVWSSASTYVAGYLNSTLCLPQFYRDIRKISPFGRFSQHFGERAFIEAFEPEEKEECFTAFTDGLYLSLNGRPTLCRPSRSLINRLYPLLDRSAVSDVDSNVRTALHLSRIPQVLAKYGFLGELSLFEQAKCVFFLIKKYLQVDHSLDNAPETLRFIFNSCRLSLYLNFSELEGCSAVYRLLLAYRNLLTHWITVPSNHIAFYGQLRKAFRTIYAFYSFMDAKYLHDQLVKVQSWSQNNYLSTQVDFRYFYPLTDGELMRSSYREVLALSPFCRAAYAEVAADNRQRIKHKYLNDLNCALIAECDKH